MKFGSRIIVWIATGGYIGKIPAAPGTFGSLLGIVLYYGMSRMGLVAGIFCEVAVIVVAIGSAHAAERILGDKDPGEVVIDEIAGMGITFLAIPFSPGIAVAGFLLFRFFDILKPNPIGWLEKQFSGGLGVVIDDLAAGLICRILLGVGCYLLGYPVIGP